MVRAESIFSPRSRHWLLTLPLCLLAVPAWAVQPSETLLPATTKGFISTQDVDEVRAEFNKTQLGDMANDPAMAPFIDDLKRQISSKMEKAGSKLGIDWDDLEGVYGGEAALGIIQPNPQDKNSHAIALIVDVSGKEKEAAELLRKIDANQAAKRAAKSLVRSRAVAGLTMTMYVQPLKAGEKEPERSFIFIREDMLFASDHYGIIDAIAGRIGVAKPKDSLATVEAFAYTMDVSEKEKGQLHHHVRWFIEPFGFAEVRRAAEGGRKKRGTDMLKILQTQGFTAIQGAGGYVFFNTGDEEMLHRTYVYAPPVRPQGDKYDLAARMMQFPNRKDFPVQRWVLPDVGAYLTFNWKTQDAFKYSETLVDALAGEKGVFKDMWDSMRIDPAGPQIDIYKGLVNHLGERVTILSDVVVPVTLKSERMLTAIEVADPATVAKTVEKAFKDDPAAKKLVYKDQVIWQITNEEEEAAITPELNIEGAGFVAAGASVDDDNGKPAKPIISAYAITVYQGHLMIATHVDFIKDLIDGAGNPNTIGNTRNYQRVQAALVRLGSKNDSFHYFAETEESYRATYDLLKQNQLPQGETMLSRLLNGFLGEGDDKSMRSQEIDGSKLPPFDQVKKYLGPTGVYVQSEDNGWYVVGCLLEKGGPRQGAGVAADNDDVQQSASRTTTERRE